MDDCKLILFDLDDTLVHFDDYWETSSKETLGAHPLSKNLNAEKLFAEYAARDRAYEQLYLQERMTLLEFRERRFIDTLAEFGIAATQEDARQYDSMFRAVSKAHIKPDAEQIALLGALSGKYKLGIVTNGTQELQLDKIESAGLTSLFPEQHVFSSDIVGHSKPHPPIFEAALAHFGMTAGETLFVGDSWQNDVIGPMRIGIRAVWINPHGHVQPEQPKPFMTVRSVMDLAKLM